MTDTASQHGMDHILAWQLITEILKKDLPKESYLTWFRIIKPLSLEGEILSLQVPSRFYFDWIESHYSKHLKRAISSSLGEGYEISFIVGTDDKMPDSDKVAEKPPRRREILHKTSTFSTNLCPQYSFDNFVEGDCNRFARAAAASIVERPGKTPFNPLLLYGGSGLGKTHLLHAIGNSIVERGITNKVLYVTSEEFTSDFIKGIQSGTSASFNKTYRNVDVLLLDDVHFFMAKEKTQEEFFHTFNSLHYAAKQLVFSSDRPPRELEGFDIRLMSRLQWGLVSELRTPEYETRLAILKKRALETNIELPDDVAHLLATHIRDNVRSLNGALIQILAQSSLIKREVTLELAREVIKNSANRTTQSVSVERIVEVTAREFDIPSDLIRSKTRKKNVSHARQVSMYLSTELTKLTLKAIGLHFGGRDHATVIHAREIIRELMKSDPEEADLVERLQRKLDLNGA